MAKHWPECFFVLARFFSPTITLKWSPRSLIYIYRSLFLSLLYYLSSWWQRWLLNIYLMISDIVQGTVTKWTLITDKIFGFLNWYRGNNTKCQSLNNNIGYVSCVLCGVEGRISRYQKPTSSVVSKISVSERVAKTVTLGFVTVNKATSSELSWISMNTGAIPDRLSS